MTIFILHFTFCNLHSFAQDYTLSPKDTSEVRFLNERKFFIYKVEKGETLYSISKKFKIPQEEITEFNSDLKDGLQPKMKLWIPAYSHLKKPEEKKEAVKEIKPENEMYSVSLLLALSVEKNFSLDTSLVDSNYVGENMNDGTIANLEFYEGALKAIDSLKLKIHLYLYDTEDDSVKTVEILKSAELKKTDLIISNGNLIVTRLINRFSKDHSVEFASCTLNAGDILSGNSKAISMTPTSMRQCKEAGKISGEKFKDYNTIVLKTSPGKENERAVAFAQGWTEASAGKMKSISFNRSIKDSLNAFVKLIKDSMSAKQNNLIFIPSSNEDLISSMFAVLKNYSEEYKITLMGLPTWQYFETIDPLLMELFDVHIFTSTFINYSAISSVRFRKMFYDTYNIEPTGSAFQGFDAMMILGSELSAHGIKLNESLQGKNLKGLYSSYQFDKAADGLSIENRYIAVMKYSNYELKKITE